MTGEITLRGRVLPVGGVREKVLAAHRAGLETVVIPKQNLKDLVDVPKRARSDLKILPVEHIDEVLEMALAPAAKTPKKRRKKADAVSQESADAKQGDASEKGASRGNSDSLPVQPGA